MSKIEELIKQYCPDGVKMARLGDIGLFYGGLSGKSKKDFEHGNRKFISYKNVYSNMELNVDVEDKVWIDDTEKQNTIHYGDILFTGSSETPDECAISSVLTTHTNEPLYLNSFCFGYRFKSLCNINLSFYKHYFRCDDMRKRIAKTAHGTTRFNVSRSEFSQLQIPLPPLPIQEKIAEILDKFSLLTAELEAELDLQKKRYDYYRNRILSFDSEPSSNSVQWRPLGEVGTFTRGRRFVRTDIVTEGQPCIHYGDMYTYYGLEASETKTHLPKDFPVKLRYADKGDVIIVAAGENDLDIGVGVAWTGNEPVAVHDACYIFKSDMNPKYVAHYLRTEKYHQEIRKYVSSAKICAISSDGIGKAMFPVRPLKEQERIVNILDRFEALVTNLSNGLPAEIERVRKQYEYYRNKLLTFPIAEQ